jgi:hypothetical protein
MAGARIDLASMPDEEAERLLQELFRTFAAALHVDAQPRESLIDIESSDGGAEA